MEWLLLDWLSSYLSGIVYQETDQKGGSKFSLLLNFYNLTILKRVLEYSKFQTVNIWRKKLKIWFEQTCSNLMVNLSKFQSSEHVSKPNSWSSSEFKICRRWLHGPQVIVVCAKPLRPLIFKLESVPKEVLIFSLEGL